ncbi:hypothetical protein LV89_03227 [Arcicella aurantiaca]|uniref:DUF456 domain-containing protein n=1 Tax=Arcicella aurantiaca TaxID=591202 RepID=A0A316DXX5_9BACT|nr:DUF456 domain-containing protein [Arcicella aurantiaca]PWK22961.1 hypothetical protein LV89_03227 [Arcicella aurantiaca]
MMDILLLIASIFCLFVGLAGAVLPLPGPPISLIGLFFLNASKYADYDRKTLTIFTLLTIIMSVFDYYAPIWGTKKFGGTKYGSWGSTIGLLAGLFFTPIGMFLGAFLGAFLGEIVGKTEPDKALKAAIGSMIGLITGIIGKVILCLIMMIYAGMAIGEYFMMMS